MLYARQAFHQLGLTLLQLIERLLCGGKTLSQFGLISMHANDGRCGRIREFLEATDVRPGHYFGRASYPMRGGTNRALRSVKNAGLCQAAFGDTNTSAPGGTSLGKGFIFSFEWAVPSTVLGELR